MIANVNEFIGSVARTELGKAAQRSARTVWNAHRKAFATTRHEAGKVLGVALEQGRSMSARGREKADGVVEDLAGAADERFASFEDAFQQGMRRVIHRIGLPTAKDVNALSRRVDTLAARVAARTPRKPARRKTKARRAA